MTEHFKHSTVRIVRDAIDRIEQCRATARAANCERVDIERAMDGYCPFQTGDRITADSETHKWYGYDLTVVDVAFVSSSPQGDVTVAAHWAVTCSVDGYKGLVAHITVPACRDTDQGPQPVRGAYRPPEREECPGGDMGAESA